MEQDSKDSAQSSATSTSTTDTASQPEYNVHTYTPTCQHGAAAYMPSCLVLSLFLLLHKTQVMFVHLSFKSNKRLAYRIALFLSADRCLCHGLAWGLNFTKPISYIFVELIDNTLKETVSSWIVPLWIRDFNRGSIDCNCMQKSTMRHTHTQLTSVQ